MKLRNLNGAVRKAADKITITMGAPDGRQMYFKVPRSAVVEGLTEAWGKDAGMEETGLMIDDDGRLVTDFVETPQQWHGADGPTGDTDPDGHPGLVEDDDLLFADSDDLPGAPAYDDDDLLG